MKKRLLTLLTLALGVWTGAWADDTYTASFTSADWTQSTANYFSSVGTKNSPNANYAGTYNEIEYSKGLKMESDTKVQFTTTRTFDITIVRSTKKNSDKTILFGTSEGTKSALSFGSTLSDENNADVAVATLTDQEAGTYQIVRGSGEAGIVFVSVTEKGTNTSPTLTVGANSATIKATESGTEVTENITVNGSNLTGSTLTATLSPAVTGLSVTLGSSTISEGSISTTATLHYSQTVNVSGSTTLTLSDGTTSKEVTVNYTSKVVPTALVAVSSTAITTMDLSKVGTSGMETLTVDDGYVVLTDAGAAASFADNLAVSCISGVGITWRSDAVQGPLFKFKTTVPGTVTLKFSDVGSSAGRANRYAAVNDVLTDVYSTSSSTSVTCSPITVEAGDVIIKGRVQGDGDTYNDNQIRVFTITFTPMVSKTITSVGWATFCSSSIVDPSNVDGLTAYIVTGGAGGVLTKTEVTGAVPANTGLLLKGDAGTYNIPVAATSTFDVSDNKLEGVTADTPISANAGYVLMATGTNGLGFYKNENEFTVGANTAYLPAGFDGSGARLYFNLEDPATGINSVKGEEFTVNGSEIYNLQGQRVAQPTKGLYIINGKKVMVK